MSAWVKYWYLSRNSAGVSTNRTSGERPTATPTALTRSRKLRAAPVPTLNRPVTFGFRNSQPTVATQSFT